MSSTSKYRSTPTIFHNLTYQMRILGNRETTTTTTCSHPFAAQITSEQTTAEKPRGGPTVKLESLHPVHSSPFVTKTISFINANKGTLINKPLDGVGRPYMTTAIIENCKESVNLLIEAGANVGNRDYECRTALHDAASLGRLEIVRILLANGAENTPGGLSTLKTPYDIALERGFLDVAQLIHDKFPN